MIYKKKEGQPRHHHDYLEVRDNEVQFFSPVAAIHSNWMLHEPGDLVGYEPINLTREEIILIENL